MTFDPVAALAVAGTIRVMHVLLTETASWTAALAASALQHAGHAVHSCHDEDETGAACVALRGRACPLEDAPVDAVVAVHPPGVSPTSADAGAVCGARRKLPVVVAGTVADAWVRWSREGPRERSGGDTPGGALIDALERAVATPLAEHSHAATQALRRCLAHVRAKTCGGRTAEVDVRRGDGGLIATLRVEPPMPDEVAGQAVAAVSEALRQVDPWARRITVRTTEP